MMAWLIKPFGWHDNLGPVGRVRVRSGVVLTSSSSVTLKSPVVRSISASQIGTDRGHEIVSFGVEDVRQSACRTRVA
jgi:hypothetical protein